MIVYLAASSKERERARRWLDALSRHPHLRLAHDWLAHMEAESRPDHEIPVDEQLTYAHDDLRLIALADFVWLLAPETTTTKGAWFECGFAYGLWWSRRSIRWVVSGDSRSAIFCSLADHRLASDEDAFDLLERIARRRAP